MKKTLHILLFAQLLVLLSSCGQATAQKFLGGDNLTKPSTQLLAHLTSEDIVDYVLPFAEFVLPNTAHGTPETMPSIFTEEITEEEVDNNSKKRQESSKYFSTACSEDVLGLNLFDNAVLKSLNNYISHTFSSRCYILFQVFRL